MNDRIQPMAHAINEVTRILAEANDRADNAACTKRMELRERFESEARSNSDLALLMDGDFYVSGDTEIAWRWFCAGADLC